MNKFLGATAALLLTTTTASAVGLDRSGQSIAPIFEAGNYFELTYGRIMPDVSGTDRPIGPFPGGNDSGNVTEDYSQIGGAFKYDFNSNVSMSLIVDQPYGSDVSYPVGGSVNLGGTRAIVDSSAISLIGRYKLDNGVSFHGGLRYQEISADVNLQGFAYGGLNGYQATFGTDGATGYLVGAAYEKPEIALRVSLTYLSSIDHDLPTNEQLAGVTPAGGVNSTTRVTTPEAWNLEFQSGVAANTLVFGSIRYVQYEQTRVEPQIFDAVQPLTRPNSLTEIENGTSYALGVGRKFSDQLSGSFSVGYEAPKDDLVSPLSPTNGNYSAGIGIAYKINDQVTISGGARYIWLGDAMPETGTPDVARADFTGNDAVAIGMKIAYHF